MGEPLVLAIGMVLVIEGLMPLVSPAQWRAAVARIAALRDGQIRFVGLGAVAIGALLIIL
ncbi:MAG: DUF2065 family protein [Burkholderiaceae bacterium]|nr:DUF2065 family protein [Burkholderiaceae bacterium]